MEKEINEEAMVRFRTQLIKLFFKERPDIEVALCATTHFLVILYAVVTVPDPLTGRKRDRILEMVRDSVLATFDNLEIE